MTLRNCLFVLLWVLIIPFSKAQDRLDLSLERITPENLDRLQLLKNWVSTNDKFMAAAFSTEGNWLAVAVGDGTVQLLDVNTLELVHQYEAPDINGFHLEFNYDDSRLLYANSTGNYVLWDVISEDIIAINQMSNTPTLFTRYSADLELLLSHDTYNQTATLYDIESGEKLGEFSPADSNPRPIISTDNSLVLTASGDGEIVVWDVESSQELYRLTSNLYELTDSIVDLYGFGFTLKGDIWGSWLAYLPENETRGVLQQFQTHTGTPILQTNGEDIYLRLYFDPTERYLLASGQDAKNLTDRVWLWNMIENVWVGQEHSIAGGILASFSVDGQLYAYGSGTTPQLFIVDTQTNETATKLDARHTFTEPVFSADGLLLLSVGREIQLWGIPKEG